MEISRILCYVVIHLGYASLHASCGLPGQQMREAIMPFLALLLVVVTLLLRVTTSTVRSYRTFSPLPLYGAVVFCGPNLELPPAGVTCHHLLLESGLSSVQKKHSDYNST